MEADLTLIEGIIPSNEDETEKIINETTKENPSTFECLIEPASKSLHVSNENGVRRLVQFNSFGGNLLPHSEDEIGFLELLSSAWAKSDRDKTDDLNHISSNIREYSKRRRGGPAKNKLKQLAIS